MHASKYHLCCCLHLSIDLILLQGPFPSENLKSWNDQGYLYDGLECQSAASRDEFFLFSSLKLLWKIEESLGLQPGELERLAEAESQFGGPSGAHAEDMEQGQDLLTHDQGGHGGVQLIAGMHEPDYMDQQMQALALGTSGEHIHLQDWTVPDPHAAEVHASGSAQDIPYAAVGSIQPEHVAVKHDPIDDIIDQPNAGRDAIDPRDGGRVLQPFGGMGSSGSAVEPAAPMTQAGPVPQPSQPAAEQPQQQSARMLAADPILNIPVHVERAAAVPASVSKVPKSTEAPRSAMPAQFISPSDLFGPKLAVTQSATQPIVQSAMPHHGQAKLLPAYGATGRSTAGQVVTAAPGARGWAAQPAPQQSGVPLADIQREELVKRQQEEAAAQAAASANAAQEQQERERRAAWTAQPQQVPLRQIMEDEECAAELEGGYVDGLAGQDGSQSSCPHVVVPCTCYLQISHGVEYAVVCIG